MADDQGALGKLANLLTEREGLITERNNLKSLLDQYIEDLSKEENIVVTQKDGVDGLIHFLNEHKNWKGNVVISGMTKTQEKLTYDQLKMSGHCDRFTIYYEDED